MFSSPNETILFSAFFSWDEWVLEDRVLKYNDANIQKQKEVSKQHASTAAKNKKGASANIGNVNDGSDVEEFNSIFFTQKIFSI